MLDGGDYLVLANVPVEHSPTCHPKKFTSLPKGTYSLTNHDILCNCTLQAKLAYLPSDLGACNDTPSVVHFEERPNIAFDTIFNNLLKDKNPPSPDREALKPISEEVDFPLNLTLPYNASESIDSLKQLYSAFTQNLSARENSDSSSYVLSQEYCEKLHRIQTLIRKQDDHVLGDLDSKLRSFLAFLFSLLNMLVSGVMIKKFERLQTITASLTLLRTAKAMSLQQLFNPEAPQSTGDPMQAKFICYDPIISGVLTGISTLSVIIVIWQQWKNKNLCHGYLYSNIFEIKLILGEDTHFLPLKLRKMAGPIHKVGINRIPSPDQLGLVCNWLWDSLTINWDGVEMTSGNEMIQLPRTIVVPFTAKFKVRQLLTAQKFSVSMALLQNNNWHDLNQKSHRSGGPSASIRRTPSTPAPRSPDSRPLL